MAKRNEDGQARDFVNGMLDGCDKVQLRAIFTDMHMPGQTLETEALLISSKADLGQFYVTEKPKLSSASASVRHQMILSLTDLARVMTQKAIGEPIDVTHKNLGRDIPEGYFAPASDQPG